jgi:hypothetical protein
MHYEGIAQVKLHSQYLATLSEGDDVNEKAKDMLMRVGFEPTPFRTSDCMMYQKITP